MLDQAREIIAYSAAGRAVIATILHAGLESIEVTESHSEVRVNTIAAKLTTLWGHPPASATITNQEVPTFVNNGANSATPADFTAVITLHAIRGEAMTGIAGTVAEDFARRSLSWPEAEPELEPSVIELLNLLDGTDSERNTILESWSEETEQLLREHWASVEAVAAALRHRSTLTNDDVEALIGDTDGTDVTRATEATEPVQQVHDDAFAATNHADKIERVSVMLRELRMEQERLAKRFHELTHSENPDPAAVAETVANLQATRKRATTARAMVEALPDEMRDEILQRANPDGSP